MDNTEKPSNNNPSREDLLKEGGQLLGETEILRLKYAEVQNRYSVLRQLVKNGHATEDQKAEANRLDDEMENLFEEIEREEERLKKVHRLIAKSPRGA